MKYIPWALVLILAVVFGAVMYFQNHVSREEVALQKFLGAHPEVISATVEFADVPVFRWETSIGWGNATLIDGYELVWGRVAK